MMRKLIFFAILLVVSVPTQQSHAAIIVTASNPSFLEGTPILVPVFARTENSDSLIGLVVDFELPSGVFSTIPGTFGQPGMIGSGNTSVNSAFILSSNTSRSSLSLDFLGSGQLFPATDQLLAVLNIDGSGLVPGTYPVNFLSTSADTLVQTINSSGVNGSFTIVAIPEPSTLGILAVASAAGYARRKRRLATLATI